MANSDFPSDSPPKRKAADTLEAALERLRPHDHLCLIYRSLEEQFQAVVPFIRFGLQRGERCVYIVDENTAEGVESALRARVDVDAAKASGALAVATKRDAYLREGAFDPDSMIAFLKAETERALAEGFAALRVTGEMTWALGDAPGTERIIEYEAKLNDFFPHNKCLAICQYNKNRFPAKIVRDVILTHPIVIYGGEVYPNLHYVPPKEFLGPDREEMEVERMLDILEEERIGQARAKGVLDESERRYKALVDNLPGMVYRCRNDADWTMEFVSEGARALTGYAPEDLIGSRTVAYADVIHPDDRQMVWDKVQNALRRGVPFTLRSRIRTADGEEKWVWEKGTGVFGEGGEVVAIEGFIQDVSDLKAAEARVEHLNDVLRAIRNVNQLIVRETDPGVLLRQACELLTQSRGYECAWIVRQDESGASCVAGWSGPQRAEKAHRSALNSERPPKCVQAALRSPGVHFFDIDADECHDCSLHALTKERGAAAVRLEHGDTVYGVLVVVAAEQFIGRGEEQSLLQELADDIAFGLHDIELETERRRAMDSLRKSENYLHSVIAALPDIIVRADCCGRYLDVMSSDESSLVDLKENLLGRTAHEVLPPSEADKVLEAIQAALQAGSLQTVEYELQVPVGNRWFEARIAPLDDKEIVAHIVDITERKRDRMHIESLSRFPSENPNPVLRVSAEGRILYANEAAEPICDDMGAGMGQAVSPAWQERIQEAYERGDPEEIEVEASRQVFLVNLVPLTGKGYVNLYARDITHRRHLEEQLRQSQKLEAIGQLAGGVAHDFNNILTGISGFAGFALQAAPPGWEAREDLEEVLNLSKRAANLTRQLLAFSRKQTLQATVLDINELVAGTTKMLGRVIGEHIALEFLPAENLRKVKTDPGQIEQVLMNLAVNARDAMPDGGSLTIETANVELDEGYAAEHAEVAPGPHVLLAVSDTGCGMDEDTLERVFDPFFTTKPVGQGTGMGLATVYGIVKQHGGHVWAYSEPGRGTTFKVYLLQSEEEAEEEAEEEVQPLAPRSAKAVLVVEDERAVRYVALRSLETQGYEVLQAANPEEAEKVFAEAGGRIALLLTDVVMPGMDGRTLYDKLKGRQPGLKVLYMSGYTENAIAHHGILDPGVAFLQKPFTPDALRRKVAEVLET